MMKQWAFGIPAALAFVLASLPAHADAIDGDWCSRDGRHMRIEGPSITIPSGARISGDYSRHTFRYSGPAGDPEEGQDIAMRLLSEELMTLTRTAGGDAGPAEEWRRCQAMS